MNKTDKKTKKYWGKCGGLIAVFGFPVPWVCVAASSHCLRMRSVLHTTAVAFLALSPDASLLVQVTKEVNARFRPRSTETVALGDSKAAWLAKTPAAETDARISKKVSKD
eukprot:168863-Amphidinium_carterae.1